MSNIVELLGENRIHIPMIQRDYAYGRKLEEKKVNNFLNEIFTVLTGKKSELRLNYIYGVPDKVKDKDGRDVDVVVLIDGQQRVTTLYLILLFFSVNAGEDVSSISSKLSYATRTTSKEFCEFLSKNNDVLKVSESTVNEKLDNHTAFFKKWRNDPTVFSMIYVLEKINKKCLTLSQETFKDALNRLTKITFEFIRLDGFKRGEALYSTMNGRGKQLTEFERIKPKVFELLKDTAPNIDGIINNQWVPLFWNYAAQEAANKGENKPNEYAAIHHDDYLFRFFRYVVTMLWCENNKIVKEEKGKEEADAEAEEKKYYKPAPIEDVLEWLTKCSPELRESACKLILFAMESFPEWANVRFEDYFADNDVFDPQDTGRTNLIFITKQKLNLIFQCCDSEEFDKIDLLTRSLLWAFIIYKWNEKQGSLNQKTLKDYFVLMLDIYAASWDSNTPISLDKSPREHIMARGIAAFRQIVEYASDCDPKYNAQQNTFIEDNAEKYWILNNYCTRRCSNNLASIIHQNGYTKEQAAQFAKNIDYLLTHYDGIDNILALEKNGLEPYFICQKNDSGRLYLPCTRIMLQSLFSMGNWAERNDWYQKFIFDLSQQPLETDVANYTVDDWQWYVKNYKDCFIYPSSFGAFDFENDSHGKLMFFEMKGVYGQKASKHQIVSPFILAAYKQKKHASENVEKWMITECKKYVDKQDIKIEQHDNGVKVSRQNCYFEKTWGDGKDFVSGICSILE